MSGLSTHYCVASNNRTEAPLQISANTVYAVYT